MKTLIKQKPSSTAAAFNYYFMALYKSYNNTRQVSILRPLQFKISQRERVEEGEQGGDNGKRGRMCPSQSVATIRPIPDVLRWDLKKEEVAASCT